MRALALVLALQAAPPEPAVAISWHPEAKPSGELRQRVRAELASRAGVDAQAVVQDPVGDARRAVAGQWARSAVERARAIGAALDQAEGALRDGRFAEARAEILRIQADLWADPGVPGAWALARRAAILEARVGSAQGDTKATDAALRAALVLDPGAILSTREVPPALARRWLALQAELLAGRDTWGQPAVQLGTSPLRDVPDAVLEVDGRLNGGPVPPGRHFLVVSRPGFAPRALSIETTGSAVVPQAPPLVGQDPLPARTDAERVCEALGLERLVLAHRRDDRVGLQVYRCGEGFGPRWVGRVAEVPRGLTIVLAGAPTDAERSTLTDPWPAALEVGPEPEPPPPPPPRPWYRRAWVWVLVGGVVAGGVTTGAVLGASAPPGGLRVEADDFLRP